LWPHLTTRDNDLNKLESTLSEDASTQVSAFLAKWFLRRRFLKNINNISLNPNDLPLKESRAPHFNKLESPSPNDDALWLVWLKLAKWFRRRSQKCKKFTDRQTDGRMDGQTDRRTPEKK